jgi:uncharacterized protein (TIGR02246 family)
MDDAEVYGVLTLSARRMSVPDSPMLDPEDARAVRELYAALLRCWNERDAAAFGALFQSRGSIVGFDGTPIDGSSEIVAHLQGIFAHHPTAAYVGKVREVRALGPGCALLRAVAGMVPPGQTALNPAVNAVQAVIAREERGSWRIELFQNTPAAFHGRPDAVTALTEELQRELEAT